MVPHQIISSLISFAAELKLICQKRNGQNAEELNDEKYEVK